MTQDPRTKLFGSMALLKEPIRADRSDVERYAICPFQAWKVRTEGIEEHNIALDVGHAIHALGEEVIKQAIKQQLSADDLADMIASSIANVRPDIQPQLIKAARYFAEQVLELRMGDIIGVEMQVDDGCKTNITNLHGQPYILTACLDLLLNGRDKSLHVWDWKTGFKNRTKEETFNDFQAQFDSNILFKLYDGSTGDPDKPRIERIHWWFIETYWGTKSYACFERNAEYPSLPHLTLEAQIEARIFEAIKLWANDSQDAWPEEKKCSWCPVVLDCPYASKPVKTIARDPKKFIDSMTVSKAAYDKSIKLAKAWLQKNGPIQGKEMVFEWRPSTQFRPKLYKRNAESEEENELARHGTSTAG